MLLVRARDGDGHEGWGECGALSQPGYTGSGWTAPRRCSAASSSPPPSRAARPRSGTPHGHGRRGRRRARPPPGRRRSGPPVVAGGGAGPGAGGVAVGVAPSVDALLAEVADHVAAGYRRVKLKVRPGWDVEPVRAVRSAWPDLPVGVDANGSYREGDAGLARLDGLGLVEIEQPLPADDLVGSAAARRLATPVCLDESVTSLGTLEAALALGALDHLNLSPPGWGAGAGPGGAHPGPGGGGPRLGGRDAGHRGGQGGRRGPRRPARGHPAG